MDSFDLKRARKQESKQERSRTLMSHVFQFHIKNCSCNLYTATKRRRTVVVFPLQFFDQPTLPSLNDCKLVFLVHQLKVSRILGIVILHHWKGLEYTFCNGVLHTQKVLKIQSQNKKEKSIVVLATSDQGDQNNRNEKSIAVVFSHCFLLVLVVSALRRFMNDVKKVGTFSLVPSRDPTPFTPRLRNKNFTCASGS